MYKNPEEALKKWEAIRDNLIEQKKPIAKALTQANKNVNHIRSEIKSKEKEV